MPKVASGGFNRFVAGNDTTGDLTVVNPDGTAIVEGATISDALAAQAVNLLVCQNAAIANGNGTAVVTAGYNGAQQLEIAETAGGTATIAIQGSMDGANWISGVGYQQVDNIAAPVRAVGNISVTANSRHVYQILDPYEQIRTVLSAVAGGATVTSRIYVIPA